MVQIKDRITRRLVKVRAGIATDCVVPCGVDAEVTVCEVAVDVVLEGFNAAGSDKSCDLGSGSPGRGCVGGDVAFETAGVVGEEAVGVGDDAVHCWLHWAHVVCHAVTLSVLDV